MDITCIECPIYLLDNIKSEIEIKEEEVDEYFETSEEFIQSSTHEESAPSLCSISNPSPCDVDSSPSMEEDPLMVITKEMNHKKRNQNNEASFRYKEKKMLEKQRLTQMLSEEEEKNAHLKRKFKTLFKEASYLKDLLKVKIQRAKIAPFYSSDRKKFTLITLHEESASSLYSISNPSSCDVDSSPLMEEDPLMVRKQNNEAAFHYRAKKKFERQRLIQTLSEEEKKNSQLIEECSNSNTSSCDTDSSPSRKEDPLIDFQLLAKAKMFSKNCSSYSLFPKENNISQSCKRRKMFFMSSDMKYQRKRKQNNEASFRYREKKRLEKQRLTQMLLEEEEKNDHLKRKFKTLFREASCLRDVLKAEIQRAKIAPFYSSDRKKFDLITLHKKI